MSASMSQEHPMIDKCALSFECFMPIDSMPCRNSIPPASDVHKVCRCPVDSRLPAAGEHAAVPEISDTSGANVDDSLVLGKAFRLESTRAT